MIKMTRAAHIMNLVQDELEDHPAFCKKPDAEYNWHKVDLAEHLHKALEAWMESNARSDF